MLMTMSAIVKMSIFIRTKQTFSTINTTNMGSAKSFITWLLPSTTFVFPTSFLKVQLFAADLTSLTWTLHIPFLSSSLSKKASWKFWWTFRKLRKAIRPNKNTRKKTTFSSFSFLSSAFFSSIFPLTLSMFISSPLSSFLTFCLTERTFLLVSRTFLTFL